MNVRKPADYSQLFAALDAVLTAEQAQTQRCYAIGRLIALRPEKGAAVAAASYLKARYPDIPGLSPRNPRRMRDFYRVYVDHPSLLKEAMETGWTQNVVILEAGLSAEERAWYLRAAQKFQWSKTALRQAIDSAAHLELMLDEDAAPHEPERSGEHVESQKTGTQEAACICRNEAPVKSPHGNFHAHRIGTGLSALSIPAPRTFRKHRQRPPYGPAPPDAWPAGQNIGCNFPAKCAIMQIKVERRRRLF